MPLEVISFSSKQYTCSTKLVIIREFYSNSNTSSEEVFYFLQPTLVKILGGPVRASATMRIYKYPHNLTTDVVLAHLWGRLGAFGPCIDADT
jgi:hypothetical protein